jgi:D-mannonate dehydratase
MATYNAILAQFGHGAGTMFFDQIVVAFAEHLAMANLKPDARAAVERAREALDAQPGTSLSMDVDKLLGRLQD